MILTNYRLVQILFWIWVILIAPIATQFTVSAKSGGASTITSPSANFAQLLELKLVTLFNTVFLEILFQLTIVLLM